MPEVITSNQPDIAAAPFKPDTPIVFLSYAREDESFVLHLAEALRLTNIEVRGDWRLVRGENYEAQLQDLQLSADVLLFVLSPESLRSAPCRAELERADAQGKPILPVLHRDVGPLENEVPKALSLPQWTFMRPSDDFVTGVKGLVEAINTDFDLMPEHRRLIQVAEIWQRNGRNTSYLLRKDGLKRTEEWLTKTSVNANKLPKPTSLQLEFIHASQAAQTRGSRILVTVVSLIAVAMAVLAIVALVQRQQARKEQRISEQRLHLAATRHLIGGSRDMLHLQPDTALLLAAQAVAASRPLAEPERRSARDSLWDAIASVRSVEFFLYGLDGEAIALGLDETGRRLFAADGGSIVQWDLSSRSTVGNRLVRPRQDTLFTFWKVVLSPDGKTFYVAIAGTGVLALDAKSGELLKAFDLGQSEGIAPFSVRSLALSEDGRWLAVGTCLAKGPKNPDCGPATILVVDLSTESVAKKMSFRSDTHIVSVAFRPGFTEIAAALEDGNIVVVDYSSGRAAYERAPTCEQEAGILAFSPDGQLLAIGCSEGRIVLWVPGEEISREINLSAAPTALAFDSAGSLAVGTKAGSIEIVDTKTFTAVRQLQSRRGAVNALTFGADRLLFSATSSGEVTAWNLALKDQFSTDLALQTAPVKAAAVNDQHNMIAAVTAGGEVAVWHLDGGDIAQTLVAPSGPVNPGGPGSTKSVAISPNGQRVAVGDCSRVEDLLCSQGRIRIWNLREKPETPLAVLERSGDVDALLFLTEDRLVSGGANGLLQIWDLGSPSKPVLQTHVGGERVSAIAKTSESTALIVGSWDGEISFWNVPDLTEKRSRLKMELPILAIAAAAQSSRFVVAEANGTTLWDLIGNDYKATKLSNSGSSILSLSADGTEVFSEIGSGKVGFWLSSSQRPYRESLLDLSIRGAAYSPARKRIVTWGDSVVIWNLDDDAWAEIVSQKANRALRPEEEDRYLDLKADQK